MSLVDLVLFVGVVWRTTRLFGSDTILDRPRIWVTGRSPFLGDLVGCPWCLSVWVATVSAAVMVGVGVASLAEAFGLICLASAVTGHLINSEGVQHSWDG